MNKKIPVNRLMPWFLISISAPAASFIGGVTWFPLLTGLAIWGLAGLAVVKYCGETVQMGPALRFIEILWMTVFLGEMAKDSASCWNTQSRFPVIPLTVLLLAAVNSRYGGERASKACVPLYWLVAGVYGAAAAIGAGSIKVRWLTPEVKPIPLKLIPLLLFPCIQLFLPLEKKPAKTSSLLLPGMWIILSILVNGSLSPAFASETENGFYEFCKQLRIFGVTERMEALVSCIITIGWFSFFSIIFSAIHALSRNRSSIWLCAAGAGVWVILGWEVPAEAAGTIPIILWMLAPIAVSKNNPQKAKKEDLGG